MPSKRSARSQKLTRRRLLTTGSAVALGGVTGCAGRVPGTGPATVDTETTVSENEITWLYPPTEGNEEGIGYTSIEFDGRVRRERLPPAFQFRFNSTVGGIASSEPYTGFEADWVRFRVGPPSSYHGMHSFEMRVQPPPALKVSTHYEDTGGRRELIVEAQSIDSDGTYLFPFVFDPSGEAFPERLHCSFTVQVSRPGTFGKTVQASDQGTLEFGGT